MDLEPRVREEGLLVRGRPVVVLLSGGRDSVCLLDLAARISGATVALHVDHGLRPGDADAGHCRALCERLGVELHVRRAPGPPRGNVQAWARELRYAAAHELAAALDADVAAGHTASDQVETVLYRLAAAPGRRALLGMRRRDGRFVRPLLGVTRAETGAHCRTRGLPWRDDPSNDARAYARNRVRHDLLAALRDVHPAAEANVLRTLDVLRDEAAVLDAAVDAALRDAGGEIAALAALPPALGRLALQRLADGAVPGAPPVGPRATDILALGAGGGTRSLDLGGGLRAVAEYGTLRFEAARPAGRAPAPAVLPVPGRVAWGDGEVACERGHGLPVGDGTLDAGVVTAPLEVRAWRDGDRMRPLGLGGSRSLQDLFCDRKVPRAQRRRLPVVLSGGEIAWVPGVATGEGFRVGPATSERLRLTWRAGRP